MLKLYGGNADQQRLCPGEAACLRFQSAKGKTRREKVRQACRGCELFDTKTDEAKKGHAALERLANSAMQVRIERVSGYPRTPELLPNIDFHVVKIIEQIVEQEEIAIKQRTGEMLMAFFGVKPA